MSDLENRDRGQSALAVEALEHPCLSITREERPEAAQAHRHDHARVVLGGIDHWCIGGQYIHGEAADRPRIVRTDLCERRPQRSCFIGQLVFGSTRHEHSPYWKPSGKGAQAADVIGVWVSQHEVIDSPHAHAHQGLA